MTGGDGSDTFRVDANRDTFGPTRITDFDPAEDALQVFDPTSVGGSPQPGVFSLVYDADEDAVMLMRGSLTIAQMDGVAESDMANIEIAILAGPTAIYAP